MQRREPWKVVLLGIITLGIYTLYWLYKTRLEMVAKGAKIPPFIIIFAPILGLIAVAILQFLVRMALAGDSSGIPDENAGARIINIISLLVGMAAVIAIIPIAIYWFYKYCKGVEYVTNGNTTFSFAFWMWLVLSLFSVSFIWPAFIQDGFNKLAGGGPRNQVADTPYPTSSPPPTPPQTPAY